MISYVVLSFLPQPGNVQQIRSLDTLTMWVGHFRFLCAHFQTQLPLDPSGDGVHHAIRCRTTLYYCDTDVGIADKVELSCFQFFV